MKTKLSHIEIDKLLHFLTSFFICAVFSIIHPLFGFMVAGGAGAIKEFIDSSQENSGFSWFDIAADFAGIVVAMGVWWFWAGAWR